MKIVFLGIGTNLGNREKNLSEAISMIRENIGKVVKASSVFESEPWGFQSENKFLNMVVKIETKLSTSGLLGRILMIEAFLGRVRGEKQYSSRVIDIDILFCEDIVIDEESLKIPHPRLHERRFVLIPLCEIDPEFVHPVLKRSLRELLEECGDKCQVSKFL
jgi:2-amino-4-hydroxy-6-hydroxymethyldihydropteridine diphosphokinase